MSFAVDSINLPVPSEYTPPQVALPIEEPSLPEIPSNVDLTSLFENLHSPESLIQGDAAKQLLKMALINKDDKICEKLFIALPDLVFNPVFISFKDWQNSILDLLNIENSASINMTVDSGFLVRWLILLQESKLHSANKAFKYLIAEHIHYFRVPFFTAAINFKTEALIFFLKVIKKNGICYLKFLSNLWNNYPKNSQRVYTGALLDWTLIHKRIPSCILDHLNKLESLSLPPSLMSRLYQELWFQRGEWKDDARRDFCTGYIKRLLHFEKYSEVKKILLLEKKILTPKCYEKYHNIICEKMIQKDVTIKEKSIDYLPLLTKQFHKALDQKNYQSAVATLVRLKTLLHAGDKRLHLPKFVLIFLQQLSNETHQDKKNPALKAFDKLWNREKDVSIWMARPPLFMQGIILYLEMTNVNPDSPIIEKILSLENSSVKVLVPHILNYLARQIHWDRKMLGNIIKWFEWNPFNIKSYLAHEKTSLEFLYSLAILCIPHKQLSVYQDICLKRISSKEFITGHAKEIHLLLALFLENNELKSISDEHYEIIFTFWATLCELEKNYLFAKPELSKLLEVEDHAFQTNPKMTDRYLKLVDSLIQWDLDLARKCLERIYKSAVKGLGEKFKNYLRAILAKNHLNDALNACSTFSQYLNESELMPHIGDNEVSNPSVELQKLIIKYRSSLTPSLWIKFCIFLFMESKGDLIVEYVQHFIESLKKISSNSTESEELLSHNNVRGHIYALILLCINGCPDKKPKEELLNLGLSLVLKHFDTQNRWQNQIIIEFQSFILKKNSFPELNKFREAIRELPGFNTSAEVLAVSALPSTDDIKACFFRAEILLSYASQKLEISSVSIFVALNHLIQKIVKKTLDKEEARYTSLMDKISVFKDEELNVFALKDILGAVIDSKCKVVEASVEQWLEIAFRPNSQVTSSFLLCKFEEEFKKLPAYNVNIPYLEKYLRNTKFPIAVRQQFFQSFLKLSCEKVEKISVELPHFIFRRPAFVSYLFIEKLVYQYTKYIELCSADKDFLDITHILFSFISYVNYHEINEISLIRIQENLKKLVQVLEDSKLDNTLKFFLLTLLIQSLLTYQNTRTTNISAAETFVIKNAIEVVEKLIPTATVDHLSKFIEVSCIIESTNTQKDIVESVLKARKNLLTHSENRFDIPKFQHEANAKIVDNLRFFNAKRDMQLVSTNFESVVLLMSLRTLLLNSTKTFSDVCLIEYLQLISQLITKLRKQGQFDITIDTLLTPILKNFLNLLNLEDDVPRTRSEEIENLMSLIHYETVSFYLMMPKEYVTYYEDDLRASLLFNGAMTKLLEKQEKHKLPENLVNLTILLPKFIDHCYLMLTLYNVPTRRNMNSAIFELEKVLETINQSVFLRGIFRLHFVPLKNAMDQFFNKNSSFKHISRYTHELKDLQKLFLDCFMVD